MHITRVEPFHAKWEKSKSAWVRIWTDTGLYGLGEASPMAFGNACYHTIGLMFWFIWKKLLGSYFALSSRSRR